MTESPFTFQVGANKLRPFEVVFSIEPIRRLDILQISSFLYCGDFFKCFRVIGGCGFRSWHIGYGKKIRGGNKTIKEKKNWITQQWRLSRIWLVAEGILKNLWLGYAVMKATQRKTRKRKNFQKREKELYGSDNMSRNQEEKYSSFSYIRMRYTWEYIAQ